MCSAGSCISVGVSLSLPVHKVPDAVGFDNVEQLVIVGLPMHYAYYFSTSASYWVNIRRYYTHTTTQCNRLHM